MRAGLSIFFAILIVVNLFLGFRAIENVQTNGTLGSSSEMIIAERLYPESKECTPEEPGVILDFSVSSSKQNKNGSYRYTCTCELRNSEGCSDFESCSYTILITGKDKNDHTEEFTTTIRVDKNGDGKAEVKIDRDFVNEQDFSGEIIEASGHYIKDCGLLYKLEKENVLDLYDIHANGLNFVYYNVPYRDDRISLGGKAKSEILYMPSAIYDKNGVEIEEYDPFISIRRPNNYKKVKILIIDADVNFSQLLGNSLLTELVNLEKVYIRSVKDDHAELLKKWGMTESEFTKLLNREDIARIKGYDVEVYIGSTDCKKYLQQCFSKSPSFKSLTISDDFGIEITDAIKNNEKTSE